MEQQTISITKAGVRVGSRGGGVGVAMEQQTISITKAGVRVGSRGGHGAADHLHKQGWSQGRF